MRKLMFILIGLFILIIACDKIKNEPLQFTSINKGFFSPINEKSEHVFTEPSELKKLITEEIPVNFSNEMLIAVFMGNRNTGGFATEITSVTNLGNSIEVNVTETSPGRRCMTVQALTQPYHIIKTAKMTKQVIFNYKSEVKDC